MYIPIGIEYNVSSNAEVYEMPEKVSGEDAVELRNILITQCMLFFEQQDGKGIPCEAIMDAIHEALDDAKREES